MCLLRINKLNYDVCIAATLAVAVSSSSVLRLADVGLGVSYGGSCIEWDSWEMLTSVFLSTIAWIYASTDSEIPMSWAYFLCSFDFSIEIIINFIEGKISKFIEG